MTKPLTFLTLAGLFLAGGCTSKAVPITYPVTGKVVFADGTPLTGGLVQFKSEANADVTTTGVIQPDGSFTLSSTVGQEQVTGAVEGPHTALILPPLGEDQHAARGLPQHPIALRGPFTVTPDGPNSFTLMVQARH